MVISEYGIKLIKQFEGLRLNVYLDCVGVKTVGWGHTGSVVNNMEVGQAITLDKAEYYLKKDLAKFEKAVNKYNPIYNFTQYQFDALVSFAFNCGSNNLKKLLKDGNRTIEEISNSFLKYNKAGGKIVLGLTNRRKAEKALFDSAPNREYYARYVGASNSISDILKSIGVNNSFAYRKKIASANGIDNYKGTYSQNMKLVNLVKNGKLVKYSVS